MPYWLIRTPLALLADAPLDDRLLPLRETLFTLDFAAIGEINSFYPIPPGGASYGPAMAAMGKGLERLVYVPPDQLVIVLDRCHHVNQLGLDELTYLFEVLFLLGRIDELDGLRNHTAGTEHEAAFFPGFAFHGLL